jgi:RimJ/RimL family protein N-acetyltransferase
MQLQTERILLREFTWDDLDAIYAYEADPSVVAYVCYGPVTKAECRQELAFHIAHQIAQPRLFYHLALVLASTEHSIGWCGVKITDPAHQQGELGYALHRAYWGQGYASEAAQALLAFGFESLNLHRIVGTCHPANQGSIRVLEKVGMSYEGCLREHKWCKGHWRSSNLYAVLDHEWRSRHPKQRLRDLR